jgi:hypothetical protein
MTEVVVSDMNLGLEEDTITTYWISYDRFIGFPLSTANARENRHQFLTSFIVHRLEHGGTCAFNIQIKGR